MSHATIPANALPQEWREHLRRWRVNAGCRLGPKDGVHWGRTHAMGGPGGYRPTTLTIDGVTRTIRGWAEFAGVPVSRIWGRLQLNWPPKFAVYVPHVPAGQRHKGRPKCRHDECWLGGGTFADDCAAAKKESAKRARAWALEKRAGKRSLLR